MPMLQPRSLATMPLPGASRLTLRRLRRPTRLPMLAAAPWWRGCGAWLLRLGTR